MKATDANFLSFIDSAPQFVIPIYQRTYSWTEKECRQLWNDILRAGQNQQVPVHFMGSVVYIEESLSNHTSQSPSLVIDGQQRLTSVTLLLAALIKALGDNEPVDGFSARKIRNRYLLDPDETDDRQFKLLLSKTDRMTLNAIVSDQDLPDQISHRVKDNFDLFSRLLASGDQTIYDICIGLSKLMIVDVALSREHDNPQLIFESMNSTGKELSQADLIRNFVLMGLEPNLQTRLYEQFWRRMEEGFGQVSYDAHFDGFMRHYLAVVTGNLPRLNDVYDAYKIYALKRFSKGDNTEDLVREMREYSLRYCAIALGQEKDTKLNDAFKDLRELRVDVSYPFLLEVYRDYENGQVSSGEFLQIVRLVEAYVFRRAICSVPTNSLNKTFATFGRALKKDRYVESVMAHFMNMKSYRRFPKDDEFNARMQDRNLYNFRSRGYWLRRFENHGKNERVHVDDYTIEHIMPQNENLSAEWQSDLGENWAVVQERWLHTLGNLTLTGYNSKYSDKAFSEKRDMKDGFKDSPLRVNKGLASVDVWNESAIRERASRLALMAVNVWAAPDISLDTLANYKEQVVQGRHYSVDDHPHLLNGHIRELFDAFSREVTALDPCVSEEFLKLYVAYKAETNFADVVPQAKALQISINIDLADLHDPHSMAIDVSDVGRWGNGNTEVKLKEIAQLPYVIGLVRQAMDRQIGGD